MNCDIYQIGKWAVVKITDNSEPIPDVQHLLTIYSAFTPHLLPIYSAFTQNVLVIYST